MKYIKTITLLFAMQSILLAGQSTHIAQGKWYEPDYGEHTFEVLPKGECIFSRAKTVLFKQKECHIEKNKVTVTYQAHQRVFYIQKNQESVYLTPQPTKTDPKEALTHLKKEAPSHEMLKTYIGVWEMLDHSAEITLLENGDCQWTKGKNTIFKTNECSWNAGKKGATMIFSNARKNKAIFLKLSENRLLGAEEKSAFLPNRAKIHLVRK